MTDNVFDDPMLDRYLAGECSPDETRAFERQLAANPALADVVTLVKSADIAGITAPVTSHIDADWALVARRAGIGAHQSSAPQSSVQLSVPQFRGVRAGAGRRRWATPVLIAGIGVAAVAVVVAHNRVSTPPVSVAEVAYAAPIGQRRNVALPDGSMAILAAGSTLRVSADRREVRLVGEALFTVANRPAHPFTVYAGRSVTTVLGTTFGVRAYSTDGLARIAVFDGRVQMAQGTVLSAGDVARVTADGRQTVTHEDVTQYRAWTTGGLEFVDTPISTVVQDLSRWYDVDVRLASPVLGNEHFSASFHGEPLDYVLHTLSVTLGARVERQGRTVTLRRP